MWIGKREVVFMGWIKLGELVEEELSVDVYLFHRVEKGSHDA